MQTEDTDVSTQCEGVVKGILFIFASHSDFNVDENLSRYEEDQCNDKSN
eukprot:CAMPEP_0170489932 /NCGR_PEP_ID=MMETSP0208-20121228/8225_1 /TAXON_ID=197538 /ORGANISM="Strombidium inclinatum, Strain S3" /LENGTH=48 /DNA_ID= /DNA_START= /DNA_END= /DNA_ORIENTATION=